MSDTVNHPNHYNQGNYRCRSCLYPIECIDVVKHMGFSRGNAVKYLWRAGHKNNEREDLLKAIWYIEQLIKDIDEREETDAD